MQRGSKGADLTVEDLVGPTNDFDVNDLSANLLGGYGDGGASKLDVTHDSLSGFSDQDTSAELAVDQLLDELRKKEAENTALKERTRRLEDHERALEDKVANLDTELEAVSLAQKKKPSDSFRMIHDSGRNIVARNVAHRLQLDCTETRPAAKSKNSSLTSTWSLLSVPFRARVKDRSKEGSRQS